MQTAYPNVYALALAYFNTGGNTPVENAEAAAYSVEYALEKHGAAFMQEFNALLAQPLALASAAVHMHACYAAFIDCSTDYTTATGAALHMLHPVAPQAVYDMAMCHAM